MSREIDHNRRRFLGTAAMAFAITSVDLFGFQIRLPFEGEFPALHGATAWLNSSPLEKASLRGKVVLINFWTYSCINWRRSLPYIRAWEKRYREYGLVVIGVHSPEFVFEKDIDNVRQASATMTIDYPIVLDNEYAIWRAFNNEFWPAFYFIDHKGHIRHQKFGEGDYDQSEAVIQQLLGDAGAQGFGFGFTPVNASGAEAAADWLDLKSAENYLGYERTQNFASSGGLTMNRPHDYTLPPKLKLNQWALMGSWTVEKQEIRLNTPNCRIAYGFHARDLHLVMGTEMRGTPIRFRILIDGQMPGSARGSDVDEHGEGVVNEPRMYHLLRQPQPIIDRKFEIEFLGAGVKAYSFTFG